MLSEALLKVREYEKAHKSDYDSQRPEYHITPIVGWCNDPNGFCYYKGEYHLFYQYYPYDAIWGPMHWGHVKSKDMVTWEYVPVSLAPDCALDNHGCFSGSAIELEDGRHMLMYTGVYAGEDTKETGQTYQQQCVAIGDGLDYEKLDHPVIGPELLPEGNSIIDFRDPKIWKDGDTYYVIISNKLADGTGVVLMYESEDAFNWKFVCQLENSENKIGRNWECPDLFELDGKYVFLASPQELESDRKEFHAGHGNMAIVGEYDKDSHTFTREKITAIDYGTDFYAQQTCLTPDGRRVITAWMANWAAQNGKISGRTFYGEMAFVRELNVRNGRLCQLPVCEIKNYYENEIIHKNVPVMEETSFDQVEGHVADVTFTIHFAEEKGCDFELNLVSDDKHRFILTYDAKHKRFHADRNLTGFDLDIVSDRFFYAEPKNKEMKIRAVLDRNSVELFVNDGEQAATFLVNCLGDGISMWAEEEVHVDVEFHKLKI